MTSGSGSSFRKPARFGPRTRLGLRHLNLTQWLFQELLPTDFNQVTNGHTEDRGQLVQRFQSRVSGSLFELCQQSGRNHLGRHIQLRHAPEPPSFSNIGSNLAAKSLEIHRGSRADVIPELYTTIGMIYIANSACSSDPDIPTNLVRAETQEN